LSAGVESPNFLRDRRQQALGGALAGLQVGDRGCQHLLPGVRVVARHAQGVLHLAPVRLDLLHDLVARSLGLVAVLDAQRGLLQRQRGQDGQHDHCVVREEFAHRARQLFQGFHVHGGAIG
jgi:hypothetical protein